MDRYVAYWSEKTVNRVAVFGPVMDPNGVYGIGVYQVQDETQMRELIKHDPAGKFLRYEILPMADAVVGNLHP